MKDKLLAGVAMSFAGLKENETNDGWHEMQDDGGEVCGSVRLKITLVGWICDFFRNLRPVVLAVKYFSL